MIKVVFFAALREQLSCNELSLSAVNISTIKQLKAALIAEQPSWQAHLENSTLLYAINQEMVNEAFTIKAGDEVAFFPPVTGG